MDAAFGVYLRSEERDRVLGVAKRQGCSASAWVRGVLVWHAKAVVAAPHQLMGSGWRGAIGGSRIPGGGGAKLNVQVLRAEAEIVKEAAARMCLEPGKFVRAVVLRERRVGVG